MVFSLLFFNLYFKKTTKASLHSQNVIFEFPNLNEGDSVCCTATSQKEDGELKEFSVRILRFLPAPVLSQSSGFFPHSKNMHAR